jgi:hypothetical protein
MPRDITAFGNVLLQDATVNSALITMGVNPFPYTPTSTNFTAANVVDLNSRAFIFHSMVFNYTIVGKIGIISLDLDLEGATGNANKYEITIPNSFVLPSVIVGEYIGYETTSPTIFETRQAIIVSNKIRIVNNHSINTSISTSDYAFSYSKRWIGNIKFKFLL